MKTVFALIVLSPFTFISLSRASVIISGYMANTLSTDSPHEYVQLVSTVARDFSVNPMTVVFTNNGTASTSGWVVGGATTYAFSINTGTVGAGDTFYVGGSGKLINGSGSTDISSATWLRTKNTSTTAGDTFGTANSSGVLGNGGTADGIGVFNGVASGLTSTTIPIDAVFFGTSIGTANPATGGYTLPNNDRYSNSATFGDTPNTYLYGEPASGGFSQLTGTYNTATATWTTARTSSTVSNPTTLSAIASQITIVPETSTSLLGLLGVLGLLRRRRM